MPLLFDHQRVGADWLKLRPRAYLADAPGVGKTRTLLWAARLLNVCPTVVCPAAVRSHWFREAEALDLDVTIYSYDYVTDHGLPTPNLLILDEAHLLKNVGARRTRDIFGRDGVVRNTPVVWAASGTPMPKHAGEFWPVISGMFPSVAVKLKIRTYAEWVQRFCVTHPVFVNHQWVERPVASRNVAELHEILHPLYLRRELDDIGVDVPSLWIQVQELDVSTPESAALRARYPHVISADHAEFSRLRHTIGDCKAASAADIIREYLDNNPEEKVIVFAHHRSVLETLRLALLAYGVLSVDGDTPREVRDSAVATFNDGITPGGPRVFLGQNTACELGIPLPGASRAYLVEPAWTAATNVQLAKRMQRHGQTAKHCVAVLLCLADTLDEAVVRKHHQEAQFMVDTITPTGMA